MGQKQTAATSHQEETHDQKVEEFLSEQVAVQYFEVNKFLLNLKNQTELEKALPTELIFEILTYLAPIDLWKLSCASHNFRFYWTEHPQLWCSLKPNKECIYEILKQNERLKKEKSMRWFWRNIYFDILQLYLSIPKNFIEFCGLCDIGRMYGEYNRPIKIGFIGPPECGKSTLTQCIGNLDYKIPGYYTATIGAEFVTQYLNYNPVEADPFCVKLEIWDLAGGDKFATIRQAYTRGLNSAFFCFDLASISSFKNMSKDLDEFVKIRIGGCVGIDSPSMIHRKICESYCETICILGLKRDLEKEVSKEMIMQLMAKVSDVSVPYLKRRVAYFEISCKTDRRDISFLCPLIYACYSRIMDSATTYRHKLTLLTKENMAQFSNYGILD
ncbi:hypothetical protein C9374_009901 [Naegleria lovaniensis]|uniref:F-box domain-containing protein n=1 Tax=Naegleria lovaniensis TaxID=51637 RepID=A0AA88GHG7_NAELO|nr:uncharacterized protein C9374_009901 [Naegleria lovaniensis]KAG2375278.1 hypothetical protein C9374_009901 [Naegleria lovaniensis]